MAKCWACWPSSTPASSGMRIFDGCAFLRITRPSALPTLEPLRKSNLFAPGWKKKINMNRPLPRFTKAHAEQLTAHDWPGNIRELQNAVERAVILAQSGPLHFELPPTDAPPSN